MFQQEQMNVGWLDVMVLFTVLRSRMTVGYKAEGAISDRGEKEQHLPTSSINRKRRDRDSISSQHTVDEQYLPYEYVHRLELLLVMVWDRCSLWIGTCKRNRSFKNDLSTKRLEVMGEHSMGGEGILTYIYRLMGKVHHHLLYQLPSLLYCYHYSDRRILWS